MSIKKFQKSNGLVPDGVVGPKTLTKFKEVYKLNNAQTANFFGQAYHESRGFKDAYENLNYSVEGLLSIFSKYFKSISEAKSYARRPQAIANKVYADRMGNGPESSGDGWKYRGRGVIQLTGKDNYTAFSKYVGNPKILSNPDVVAEDYYLDSGIFFFRENSLFDKANDVSEDTIRYLTKRINGGYNGLKSRIQHTLKFYEMLK